MPLWVEYVLAVAFFVIGFALFRAVGRLEATAGQVLALLRQLTEKSGDGSRVLAHVASQLGEVVAHLERSSEAGRIAGELLRAGAASERQLSAIDREQMLRLVILLNELGVIVTASAATGERIEQHGFAVADDLAKAHGRANEVTNGEPGAAADAAAQHTEKDGGE